MQCKIYLMFPQKNVYHSIVVLLWPDDKLINQKLNEVINIHDFTQDLGANSLNIWVIHHKQYFNVCRPKYDF